MHRGALALRGVSARSLRDRRMRSTAPTSGPISRAVAVAAGRWPRFVAVWRDRWPRRVGRTRRGGSSSLSCGENAGVRPCCWCRRSSAISTCPRAARRARRRQILGDHRFSHRRAHW